MTPISVTKDELVQGLNTLLFAGRVLSKLTANTTDDKIVEWLAREAADPTFADSLASFLQLLGLLRSQGMSFAQAMPAIEAAISRNSADPSEIAQLAATDADEASATESEATDASPESLS